MPFYYFGGKSKLARRYPPPVYDTVIEPFAGSAAYALHHATRARRVILIEKDERIADIWHRLQAMTEDDVLSIVCPEPGCRTTEPLMSACPPLTRSRFANPTDGLAAVTYSEVTSVTVGAFELPAA